MDRCWLQGALGDALHTIACAAGSNPAPATARHCPSVHSDGSFLRLLQAARSKRRAIGTSYDALGRTWAASMSNWIANAGGKKLIFSHAAQGVF